VTASIEDHHQDRLQQGFIRPSRPRLRAVYHPAQLESTLSETPEYLRLSAARLIRALTVTLSPEYHFRNPLELALIRRAMAVIADVVPAGDVRFVPDVVPSFDGGLQLEWHLASIDAEVFFDRDGDATVEVIVGGEFQFEGDYRNYSDDLYKQLWNARERLAGGFGQS
jgi:hypothetical protein